MASKEFSREDWDAGLTGDEQKGCSNGCLVLTVACVVIDALALIALCHVLNGLVQFFAWLLSIMSAT